MSSDGTSRTTPSVQQPEEQLRYARLLDLGTRFGLVALVGLFVLYLSGVWPPHVPVDRLPTLWAMPVSAYLQATGSPTGWAWVGMLGKGDVVNLLGIAILAGCSVLCLAALVPLYLRRGDRVFAVVVLAELLVMALAASGLLTAGH